MEKKKAYLTVAALTVLLLVLVAVTYAYFRAQGGGLTSRDVSVTSNTTDLLTFQIGNDISFTASTSNFYQGGSNVSGSTTTSATLVPNNNTNQATMHYYMYLNLTSNPIIYSSTNTNEDPELILQVFNGSNQLVTLTGLGNQVTVGGLTGYDITGVTGLLTLLDNHAITANGSTEVENWSVVITLINLGVDQNDNTNKTVTGEVIMRKDEVSFCEIHPEDLMCYTMANYNASTMATGTTNLLYYHDENLEDGAEDGSYRYAGSNPNNYVCFGSDANVCPADNLYRIIGFMPVDVVTDDTTTPVTTESKMLYKLIKNDYLPQNDLGITKDSSNNPDNEYTQNVPSGSIDYYHWNGTSESSDNLWNESLLNHNGLNGTYLNALGSTWQNKIATVMWKVGGAMDTDIYLNNNVYIAYQSEITNSGIIPSGVTNECLDTNYEGWCPPSDNIYELDSKIGLIYASDYGYASPQSTWSNGIYDYYRNNNALSNDWIYRGCDELTITRVGNSTEYIFKIDSVGYVEYSKDGAVRPTFYLTKETTVDRTLHAGTISDPYRVS